MKKNRKRSKKLSVVGSRSLHFGAVLVVLFAMILLNLLANTSCNQTMKSIGDKERQLVRLEEELLRESARWEEMKSSENLERLMLRNGISMKLPRPDQYVYMRADGTPRPGQLSVARARQQRLAGSQLAARAAQTGSRSSRRNKARR